MFKQRQIDISSLIINLEDLERKVSLVCQFTLNQVKDLNSARKKIEQKFWSETETRFWFLNFFLIQEYQRWPCQYEINSLCYLLSRKMCLIVRSKTGLSDCYSHVNIKGISLGFDKLYLHKKKMIFEKLRRLLLKLNIDHWRKNELHWEA